MTKKIAAAFFMIALAFTISGCIIRVPGIYKSSNADKNIKMNTDASTLNSTIQIGNTNVNYGEGKAIQVNADLKLISSKNIDFDSILKLADIHLYQKDKTIYVTVVNKNNNEDIWEWLKKSNIDADLTSNINITIPRSINEFMINSKVGNTNLNNPTGLINVQDITGNIELQNPKFSGESNLHTNVGNISCTFNSKQSEKNSLQAITNVGNITIKAENGIFAKAQNGGKNFINSSSQITITDNFTIKAKTNVGNILIE